jgi:formylmethanofuran:tetrahydromethanopterin formyltransferase
MVLVDFKISILTNFKINFFYMDEESKLVLKLVGIEVDNLTDIEGLIISREIMLSDAKYDEIKKYIPELKKKYSSSFMTSLQKNADKNQKWPLLNLVRQILSKYNFKMYPIRKADGYTLDGVKKYKRYFQIKLNT